MITVTKKDQLAAQIVSPAIPQHLAALVAEETVRPSEGSRSLPKPLKPCGSGMDAAEYVIDGRR